MLAYQWEWVNQLARVRMPVGAWSTGLVRTLLARGPAGGISYRESIQLARLAYHFRAQRGDTGMPRPVVQPAVRAVRPARPTAHDADRARLEAWNAGRPIAGGECSDALNQPSTQDEYDQNAGITLFSAA